MSIATIPDATVPEHARMVVSGDIDLTTVDALTAASGQVLGQRPGRIVLDLSGTYLCDAAGLGALARIHLDCRHAGCELVLTNVAPAVREVIDIVGMDRLLRIEDGES